MARLGLATEHPVPHGTAAPTFHAGSLCGGDNLSDDKQGDLQDIIIELVKDNELSKRITLERVTSAIADFELQPIKPISWIVDASKRAFYFVAEGYLNAGAGKGNAATRDELKRLSDKAQELWLSLFEISEEADEALFWCCFRNDKLSDFHAGLPKSYEDYKQTISSLNCVALLLKVAASDIGNIRQSPRWREKEQRAVRVQLAVVLAEVFTRAYGRQATVNRWNAVYGKESLGPWPDFFRRIASIVLGAEADTDLEGVLNEARQIQINGPVIFEPGFFPE